MKSTKLILFIQHWLSLKPYEKQAPTDFYYLRLSNNVHALIEKQRHSLKMPDGYDTIVAGQLACFLVSYLEDLVSDSNIWNTFVKEHRKRYGKEVPFFEIEEYYENEINLVDVKFLIWYFLNSILEKDFVFPNHTFIEKVAPIVFNVFEKEWEYAPENRQLKMAYTIEEDETDFYLARGLMDKILLRTYLFFPDLSIKFNKEQLDLVQKYKNNQNLIPYMNDMRDNFVFSSVTKLLALKGNDWASLLLGEQNSLSAEFKNVSPKIVGYFIFKGFDNESVILEYIATGQQFLIPKISFQYSTLPKEVNTILFIGIVQWKGKWWFSGVFTTIDYNDKLIESERNNYDSIIKVDFLNEDRDQKAVSLKLFEEHFMALNKNKSIVFMKTKEFQSYLKKFYDSYNKRRNEMIDKNHTNEASFNEDTVVDFFEDSSLDEKAETGFIFFNPKTGIEIITGYTSAFAMKENPYFIAAESENDIVNLILDKTISTELSLFCIELGKNTVPFFKTNLGKLILNETDFLLRFWKGNEYESNPRLTLLNK